MTFEELLALTTIKTCDSCKLDHAPVRTCEEAKLEHELVINSTNSRKIHCM